MANFYCAMWHDLTPSKIDDEDPLCIFKIKIKEELLCCHVALCNGL
jgi:hypothetical protein